MVIIPQRILVADQDLGQATIKSLCYKSRAAAGNVGQLADQVRVHPRGEILQVEVDVLDFRAQLGGEVIAQVFGCDVAGKGLGADEGAARFGHFQAIDGEETVGEDRRRHAKPAPCSMAGQNRVWK